MRAIAISVLVLLCVTFSYCTTYGTGFKGYTRYAPPRSTVLTNIPQNMLATGGLLTGNHNRWGYTLNVCGKNPLWFSSDVAQCSVGNSGLPGNPGTNRDDCVNIAYFVKSAYENNACPFGQPGVTCNNGNCNYFLHNGQCSDDQDHSTRAGDYDDWDNGSSPKCTGARCPTDYLCNKKICATSMPTARSRMTISGIKTDLQTYDKRNGVRVEIDLAYGYSTSNPDSTSVTNARIGGISVDAYLQAATPSFNGIGKVTRVGFPIYGTSQTDFDPITLVDTTYPTTGPTSRNLVSCTTLVFDFDNVNLPADGTNWYLGFAFFNNYLGNGVWAYDATGTFGSEIAVSEVRVFERVRDSSNSNQNCIVNRVPTSYPTSTFPATKYQFSQNTREWASGILAGSSGYTTTCDVCTGSDDAQRDDTHPYNGDVYCSRDVFLNNPSNNGNTFEFMAVSFARTFTGVTPLGGYLILYGAEIGNTATISLIMNNGNVWISNARPVVATPAVNGKYFLCGNCQYQIWAFDSIDGVLTDGSTNSGSIFTSGADYLCVNRYQFVFYTQDTQGPTNIATSGFCKPNGGSADYTVQPGAAHNVTVSVPGNTALYYNAYTALDNCETYSALLGVDAVTGPYSLKYTTFSIWDYVLNPANQLLQVFTLADHSGAQSSCNSKVNIVLGVAGQGGGIITYPGQNAVLSIQNIFVRWVNYEPILDNSCYVKITIIPGTGGSCAGATTVLLTENWPYLDFSNFRYRGPTTNINTNGCVYTLNLEITNPTHVSGGTYPNSSIFFQQTGITFQDLS